MLTQPLGLLALLALPAIVVLHLFRHRLRTVPVSAVFLWAPQGGPSTAGRRRVPLHQSPSLWLELLAALLLTAVLSGLRGCGGGQVEHLVLVLDGSGSMASDGLRDAALSEANALLRRLDRNDRATVIQTGPQPSILAGPAVPRREAMLAMEQYAPAAVQHDLQGGVSLGWELSGGQVTLITDHHQPDQWPETVSLISVGQSAENVAFTTASRMRTPEGERLFVTVQSFADSDVRAQLRITANGQLISEQSIALPVGEDVPLSLPLPPQTSTVQMTLSATEDALALDSHVVVAAPPARMLNLAVALPNDVAVRTGLGARGVRWAQLVEDSQLVSPSAAHLLLTAQSTPTNPATWPVVIAAGSSTSAFVGPFLLDRSHPLLDGVALQGVVWSASRQEMPGVPLISAGDQPLLTEEVDDSGQRRYHLNIDLNRSNLHRTPSWPIFLSNLARLRRASLPGPVSTNLLMGEMFQYTTPPPGQWTLHSDNQSETLTFDADLIIDQFPAPGVYTLHRDGEPVTDIAVRFLDAGESDLTQQQSGRRESAMEQGVVQAGVSGLDSLLLLGLLGCLAMDWWVLWRAEQRGS